HGADQHELFAQRVERAIVEVDRAYHVADVAFGRRAAVDRVAVWQRMRPELRHPPGDACCRRQQEHHAEQKHDEACAPAHPSPFPSVRMLASTVRNSSGSATVPTASCENATSGACSTRNSRLSTKPFAAIAMT